MDEFLFTYGINTLASSFDLLTTAVLHRKTGNPNEMIQFIRHQMQEKGPFRAALEGEFTRRIGYLAIGLIALSGEKLFTYITNQAALPIHSFILYGAAFFYATAGLFNLLPIAFNKGNNTDIF